ncbi:hypothetical protein HELRODRAFT_185414 [Helobdella robusta]|uniref:Annexin n=1 Tax=Helobdella robusta TaxID=6412 RepID=T1FMS5_HELRO|nr:hypothetical protein HELRODRAFT_185414 [Helobdella robusta]ESO08026.1 hypothetical protein HELRODRAFT_185414 [Helobdella robusta]
MATIVPNQNFNPLLAANDLIAAFKGIGTNEAKVIQVTTSHDNKQRQEIKSRFQLITGKDLNKELKSELSGNFGNAVLSLFVPSYEFFADLLMKTMKGPKTDESMMAELLCTHDNKHLALIKDAYNRLAGRSLEEAVATETTGELKRLWSCQVRGARDESSEVSVELAHQDARDLFKKIDGRFNCESGLFIDLLCGRNFGQLRETFNQYQRITSHSFEEVINNETKGQLKKGLLAVVSYIKNPHVFFADLLYDSFKGLGTKNDDLTRILVTRAEIDLLHIANAYRQKYSKPLAEAIKSECSGDFRALLLAMI